MKLCFLENVFPIKRVKKRVIFGLSVVYYPLYKDSGSMCLEPRTCRNNYLQRQEAGKKKKEYVSTKPALQEIIKGLLSGNEGKGRESEGHWYEKLAVNKYLSIITLNINGLKCSNQKT